MPFGYIPHRTPWKNVILRILGTPNAIRRIQAPIIMRMLNVKETDIIGDLGCAAGHFTYEIAKKAKMAIGVDLKLNENVSFAMRKQHNVFYLKADVQKLALSSGNFNKILLSSVLQMVKNDKQLLKECYRVLKQWGELVLSVPVEYIWIKKLNLIKDQLRIEFGSKGTGYYNLNEVSQLLQNEGFNILEIEYAPRKRWSFVYELWLLICYHLGLAPLSPYSFFFLYPLSFLEKLPCSKISRGNEVLIKGIKIE